MFKIEKSIPIPTQQTKGRKRKYPLDEMEVGDSFLLEKMASLRASIHYFQNTASGKNKAFTIRKQDGGLYRCWRIK